jgi:hypothetical protein
MNGSRFSSSTGGVSARGGGGGGGFGSESMNGRGVSLGGDSRAPKLCEEAGHDRPAPHAFQPAEVRGRIAWEVVSYGAF